jgi:aconitase A
VVLPLVSLPYEATKLWTHTHLWEPGDTSYLPTPSPVADPSVPIAIDPSSSRLELLEPFSPHFTREQIASGEPLEFKDVRVLLRIRGKCTTDEISAAGSWLKYKGTWRVSFFEGVVFSYRVFWQGHLSNISENTLIGATNDETGRINSAVDYTPDGGESTIPEMAKRVCLVFLSLYTTYSDVNLA